MSTNDTYLAVFTGTKTSPRRKAWDAMPDDERHAKEQTGRAAWGAWVEKHQAAIVNAGGPLGKTKRASRDGVADGANELAVFMIVRAPSHEAAAKLFEGHPHFTIFPGEAVEVMPLLPVPGA
ncbi:MAG: hypothetical protein ABL864_12980 [Terricaulis sp.]|jgi:hypothetical protein